MPTESERPQPSERVHLNRQLTESLQQLSKAFEAELLAHPGAVLIIGGSFSRRLAVANLAWQNEPDYDPSKPLTLEYYLQHQNEGINKPPRRTDSGRYDFDIAIPDTAVTWEKVIEVAQTITEQYPNIEVDPHVMKLLQTENGQPGFLSNNHAWAATIPLKTVPVDVGNNQIVHIMSLETQIYYLSSHYYLAHKNYSEVKWLYKALLQEKKLSDAMQDPLIDRATKLLIKRLGRKDTYIEVRRALFGKIKKPKPRDHFFFDSEVPRYF